MSILVLASLLVWGQNFQFLREAEVDLDGDGILERVSIQDTDELGNFTLRIDGLELRGNLGDTVNGFIIVDIDSSDSFKEVGIHTPGPSDDDKYLMIYYTGKEIKTLGLLTRWPSFQGNGIIYVDDWMGFWRKREKYVLNKKKRILERVPQELYYVGVEATVVKTFPIYKSRDSSQIIANLKEGSKILIIACSPEGSDDMKHWYLIKSESGLLGYAKLESFFDKVEGLPWAD